MLEQDRINSDRSQFVRFARMTATWMQWGKEGVITQANEATNPSIVINNDEFKFGVCLLSELAGTESVVPATREEEQRTLEAMQVYFRPIIVTQGGQVIGNHDMFAAAKSMQSDLARPGKIRPSDYCLVAITNPSNVVLNEFAFTSTTTETSEIIAAQLLESGFSNQLPKNGETALEISWNDSKFFVLPAKCLHWKSVLEQVFKVRKLDINANPISSGESTKAFDVTIKTHLKEDFFSSVEHNESIELLPGTIVIANTPQSGTIMWSPREFSF